MNINFTSFMSFTGGTASLYSPNRKFKGTKVAQKDTGVLRTIKK